MRGTFQPPSPDANLRSFEQIAALPDEQFDVAEAVLALAAEAQALRGDTRATLLELDRLASKTIEQLPENPDGIDYCDVFYDVVLERRKAEPFREDAAEDYDLSFTVSKRRGACLSVGIMALAVARRAGAPFWGAQCPGHFFLKYVPPPGAKARDRALNFDVTRPTPRDWGQLNDNYYRRWKQLAAPIESSAGYLRPLSDREVVSAFLASRAGFFAASGRHDAALKDAQRALNLSAGNLTACINGGLAHESLGSLKQAEELYLKALRIDANSVRAMNNLAYLKVRLKDSPQFDPKEAERLIQQALKREPERAFLHATLAEIKAAQGEQREATRAMQTAIRFDPKNARYRERFMQLRAQLRGEE